jgi:hypothetical protein
MDKRNYDTVHERRVGVRTRPDDVTVHVMGEELPLTLGVERAARLIGVGRSTMYTAVKRGDFETIQLNGRTVLLTLPLLERIGIDVDATARLAPSR